MTGQSQDHSVIVVGAGIAGLAAARRLLPTFPDLAVVEATNGLGGRVDQVRGILPWPVELGAEFIHGAKTSLKELLDDLGCKFQEKSWPDHWYIKSERRLKAASEKDDNIATMMERFESIGQQNLPAQDLSAEQWLREGGATQAMIDIADACFANDFGCSISQLGLRETILENQRWNSGDTYLILDRSLSEVIQHMSQNLEGRIQLQWPVDKVTWGGDRIVLSSTHGQELCCRHLVLTVPLSILQQRRISFAPPLPDKKLAAISRLKMSSAVKIILALKQPIWPQGFFDVVCPGCFIPEFWVTRYPADKDYQGQELYGITGFVCGIKAEEISKLSQKAIIKLALAQLDDIFGSGTHFSARRAPATAAFVCGHIADWSTATFIEGAYSYPSLGAKLTDRDALAQAVGSKIFFAGEATHSAINPCLQAAYDTGIRAADEVLDAAFRKLSKL